MIEKLLIGEMTYEKVLKSLEVISQNSNKIMLSSIGKSLLGRELPIAKIGEGKKKVLYIGTHHACERITASLLLKFINEIVFSLQNKSKEYGIDIGYIFRTRTLYFIPMLNPDGVDLSVNGLKSDNIIYQRLVQINPGCDFSYWQANARGVDLNHNYNADFEEYRKYAEQNNLNTPSFSKYPGAYPQSEPEVSALVTFINTLSPFECVYTFHTQGEEIYGSYKEKYPKNGYDIGKALSRLSGYALCEPTQSAAYSGLKDWYIKEYNLPAFTIECGRGKNPLPPDNLNDIYLRIRKMLFTTLIL